MSTLSLRHIDKIYDNKVQAVFDFNLEIKDKEFIVLVGPSGCGKSTTLRMIAGLEEITNGELYIDDKFVNTVMPKNRDIAMVFQNYALYPHMTVFQNMAFGLTIRKHPIPVLDKEGKTIPTYDYEVIENLKKQIHKLKNEDDADPKVIEEFENKVKELEATPTTIKVKMVKYTKAEINERVGRAAEILGLTDYLKRKPGALSGGQRQRVAVGRAIVRNPKVFLMDEPLSNLDAKLRVQMRSEIVHIHNEVGATTVYVTHDQTEAMTMASRVVIMKDGYIQQVGTPDEVFNNPANMFVGGFIGSPSMNFIKGRVKKDKFIVSKENSKQEVSLQLPKKDAAILKEYDNKEVVLGIRPEDSYLSCNAKPEHYTNEIPVVVDICELLGNDKIIYGDILGQNVAVKANAKNNIESGAKLPYVFDADKLYFFDPETTLRIR